MAIASPNPVPPVARLRATVGMLGLFSTMVVRVLERRREIAVLGAVGATSRTVLGSVLLEGVLVGALLRMHGM